MIVSRPRVIKRGGKQREGKGFSPEELRKTGLSLGEAVRLHIPVDPRRKTVHEENVEIIKALLESKKPDSKPKKLKRKSKS